LSPYAQYYNLLGPGQVDSNHGGIYKTKLAYGCPVLYGVAKWL